MRIGIDAHMVGSRETGNETYCMGLIEGLEQIEDHNQYMVYLRSPSVLPSVNGHGRLLRRMLRRGSSAWRLLMGFAWLGLVGVLIFGLEQTISIIRPLT